MEPSPGAPEGTPGAGFGTGSPLMESDVCVALADRVDDAFVNDGVDVLVEDGEVKMTGGEVEATSGADLAGGSNVHDAGVEVVETVHGGG